MPNLSTTFNDLQSLFGPIPRPALHSADKGGGKSSAIETALARMELMAPGDTLRMEPVPGSLSADIRRVQLGWGTVCVKQALPRVKRSDVHAPIDRSRTEFEWLKLAHGLLGCAVPEPLGQHGTMLAMEYLCPERHPSWFALLRDGNASPSTAAEAGRLIGRMHAATAYNFNAARAFDSDRSFNALNVEPMFEAVAKAQPPLAERIAQVVSALSRTRIALIHGDFVPANILVGPRGPVVTDGETASFGDPAFDVASCLAQLLILSVWRPQQLPSCLTCFDAFCAAYSQRVTWEMPEQTSARAALLLPAILLGRMQGRLADEYPCEQRDRDAIVGLARRLLVEPVVRLAAVRETWRRSFCR